MYSILVPAASAVSHAYLIFSLDISNNVTEAPRSASGIAFLPHEPQMFAILIPLTLTKYLEYFLSLARGFSRSFFALSAGVPESLTQKLYASYSAIAIAVKNRNDSLTLKNGVRSGGVYLKGDYWTRNDYIADVIGRAVAPDELFYGDAVIDWSYVCDHTGSEILMSVLTDDGKEEFIRKVPDSWYIDSKFPNFYTNRLSREVRLNNPKIFK